MYKKLHDTKEKINEDQVDLIKEISDKIKKEIQNAPKNKKILITLKEEIINIVEHILYFNQLDQQGSGLKILTLDQMLSRLPLTLAQLKQEIILKNLEMKLDNFCILCTDHKKLLNNSIKV